MEKVLWQGCYKRKKGTNSAYIFAPYMVVEEMQDKALKAEARALKVAEYQGAKGMLLPFKIYFIFGNSSAPVSNTGRGAQKREAQLKANFAKYEVSPYKIAKPYKVCTSIWQVKGRKCIFYGTIGITPSEGLKPADNGDLVIFYTSDWEEVQIFIFKGLCKPNGIADLEDAVKYVDERALKG